MVDAPQDRRRRGQGAGVPARGGDSGDLPRLQGLQYSARLGKFLSPAPTPLSSFPPSTASTQHIRRKIQLADIFNYCRAIQDDKELPDWVPGRCHVADRLLPWELHPLC